MKQRDFSPTGSRQRKKHKRLDAINENVYNQNHNGGNGNGEGTVVGSGSSSAAADSELRRSLRVRRAPVLLDASPPPVKKRRKAKAQAQAQANAAGKNNDKHVQLSSVIKNSRSRLAGSVVKEDEGERLLSLGHTDDDDEPLSSSWRSRLRSRGRNDFGRGESGQVSGKRKLFDDKEEGKGEDAELGEKERDLDGGDMIEVRSFKRTERVKMMNELGSGENEGGIPVDENVNSMDDDEMQSDKDENGPIEKENGGLDEKQVLGNEVEDRVTDLGGEMDVQNELEVEIEGKDVEAIPVLGGEIADGNEVEAVPIDVVQLGLDAEDRTDSLEGLLSEKKSIGTDNVENVEQSDNNVGVHSVNDGETAVDEKVGVLMNEVDDFKYHDGEKGGLVKVDEIPLDAEKDAEGEKLNSDSIKTLDRSRIKQGRRCGLCGCGNDGKPPKKLVQHVGESENEAYSGSSASEDPNYDKWDGFGDEPGWLGRLLGPINDRYGIAGIWVHQHCAVWSPEVYFAGLGCLKNVRAALCRGRVLKCSRCGRPGATIGCRVDRCPKTYHLPCARSEGCIFDHRKFLIACIDHRHLFQPQGNQYLLRIKELKAKKMKLEMRKLSNDAWRKDVEAEEKWLENCGEDEEFLKRESKRLHRDLLRIAPVYIGGSNSESGNLFEGWESVAGLQDVIQCLKEVVFLPLLYPEFFSDLGITPPRGVLLHGYPGTGKTLVVRALIGSCARGDKRIAYFARKGADCLGKYVGDAERQLRLLFQVAEKSQPSIIFFDEIDGLAPSRTRQQDQTHSSVVSTLLALMDGLKSRGSVVVIGATNRPEAVDPALRRPGRFDREIYFPLPSAQDRAAILSLHTKRWPKPVAGSLLHWISERTVGFAGADLQALCTQAAIIALKRNFPLQKFLSAAGEKGPASKRLPLPAFAVEERDWLEALACAPPPCSQREAGIAAYDLVSCPLPTHLIPCLLQPLSTLVVSLYLDERLWLPTPLLKAAKIIKSVMVSFLEKNNLPSDHWSSYVDKCLKEAAVANEVQRRLSSAGIIASGIGFCSTGAFTDENDNNSVQTETPMTCNVLKGTGFSRSICFMEKKSGFHVLISGSPRSGQRHLASCIMHCFVGNVEIKKVDLATVSQEGHGDMAQGITRILMKCAGLQSCMIFMPRIDLWAVERCHPLPEESNYMEVDSLLHQCKDAEMAEPQASIPSASHAWSLFIEQVESICVSTSLMILATSELPYSELPPKVNQFFKCDVTNTSQPIPLEHTIPQFSLHVDGNVNYDMMISLATTKLLGDIVQSFVQLIYQRTHSLTSSLEDYKIGDSIQGSFDAECHGNVHGSNNESEGKVECSRDSSFKVSPLPLSPAGNSRGLKGKSSLLLSISTFGYQLLRYPHFAELCWVTSKLKEGPSADVSGPWKGWPFNSCIIRPGNSSDKVAVAFNSGNIKSKDKSGYVRGLVAVGLSAYRGVYTSVREVSFEVRKVLELLVGQVNEKIEAGKDQYQYLRLLSQVAYLEDMVNSWAHALYSLELDAQMKMGTLKQSPGEFSDKDACTVNSVQVTGQGFGPQNLERADVTDRVYSDDPDPELPGPLSGSSKQSVVFGESNQDKHLQNSIANSYLIGNIMHEQNLRCTGQCEPENSGSLAVTIINSDSKNSDGCLLEEPIISTEIGHGSSGECVAHQVSSAPLNQINRWNSTRPDGCFLRKSVISAEICHGCSSEVCATCEICAPEVSGVPCNRSNGLGSGERGTQSVNPDPDSIELTEDLHYSPGTTTCLPGVVESGSQSNNLEPHSIEHMEGMHCSPGRATSLAGTMEKGSPLDSPESPSIEHTVEIRYSPCRTSSPMDAVERGTQSEHHFIEPDSIQHFGDKNCSPSKATSLSVEAGVLCLYRCCSGCLSTLWSTIRHILLHECPSTKNHWTVDDFHDAFASLSVDLISVVRKMGNTFDEDLTCRRPKGSYGHPRQHRCDCREGNTLAILKKCPCHPEGGCESAEANTSSDSLFGLDLKFVFRDGVLVLVESDKDLTFHCKYETLCLCSPIESMVMLKQPSER